jgi:hypothetical protein
VSKYIILADILYRKSFDGLLLRCLKQSEIPITLVEAHVDACGGHFVGRCLVQNLIHIRYYWRNMEQYCLILLRNIINVKIIEI